MLAKSKLSSIEVLNSKSLIDSRISHNEFILINYVLKEYDDMKEEIKNLKTEAVSRRLYSIHKTMLLYCLKYCKNAESGNPSCQDKKRKNNAFIKMCSMW